MRRLPAFVSYKKLQEIQIFELDSYVKNTHEELKKNFLVTASYGDLHIDEEVC